MTKLKDDNVLNDLVTRKAELGKEFAEVSDSLAQQYNSDGWDKDDAKFVQYQKDQMKHAQLSRELSEVKSEIALIEDINPRQAQSNEQKEYNDAFRRFMSGGSVSLDKDEYERYITVGDQGGEVFNLKQETEAGASRSDDGTANKVTDDKVQPRVIENLVYYGGIGRMAQMFTTPNGNELHIPTQDDADAVGRLLNQQDEKLELHRIPDFDNITFGAQTMTTDTIPITRELLTDSIINFASYASRTIGRRTGRGWDKIFTNHGAVPAEVNGAPASTKAPKTNGIIGVVHVAKKGVTTAEAGKVSYADLVDHIYSIARAYRTGTEGMGPLSAERGGRIGWLISDDFEKVIRKLTDEDGRPLWQAMSASIGASGMSASIVGYPYEVSGQLDNVASGKVPALFGNFSYYAIRQVSGLQVFRFMDAHTMQRNRIEMIGLSRAFGRAMFPGTAVQGTTASKTAYGGIPQIAKLTIK